MNTNVYLCIPPATPLQKACGDSKKNCKIFSLTNSSNIYFDCFIIYIVEFHMVVCGLDSIIARRWINGMLVCFHD